MTNKKRNRMTTKPHRVNFRATDEQVELVEQIMIDLGLDRKTDAIEHIFETYVAALKVITKE